MKKEEKNGLFMVAIVVGIALWFGRKKGTKAGPLILDLDEGQFGTSAPGQLETVIQNSTDPQGNQIKYVGPFEIQYGQAIAGNRHKIGSKYIV